MSNLGNGAASAERARVPPEAAGVERLTDILGRFTTHPVAKAALWRGSASLRRGERRVLTVLFADVRNFTSYVASVAPEEATEAVNEIFGCLCRAVMSANGDRE